MTDAFHHLQKRKRIHEKHEPYPHPDKWKRLLDSLIYVIGVLGPVMALPQLYLIWVDKVVAGVSAVSWGAFAFIAIFWIIYGFVHNEKPIIITYIGWFIVEILIVVGILING